MPELAAFFFIGILLTLLANAFHVLLLVRTFHRNEISNLQFNLEKVQKYWSITDRRLVELPVGKTWQQWFEKDRRKSIRSALIFGGILTLLSWLGLLLFILYFLSVQFLAKPRVEHKIFESDLILHREVPAQILREFLKEVESMV